MGIKPMGDRVLVKPHESETESGGIIIPGEIKSDKADVLAVGPGYRNNSGELVAPDVKVGDVVLMPQYGGTDISQDGEKLILLNVGDIVATVED